MERLSDEQLAALIRKTAAKAAKAKQKARRQYDDTLQPEPDAENDIERRNFFSEMQKREF